MVNNGHWESQRWKTKSYSLAVVQFSTDLEEDFLDFSVRVRPGRLHPEKTRLIEFGRYAAERRGKRGEGKPETFNFLGF